MNSGYAWPQLFLTIHNAISGCVVKGVDMPQSELQELTGRAQTVPEEHAGNTQEYNDFVQELKHCAAGYIDGEIKKSVRPCLDCFWKVHATIVQFNTSGEEDEKGWIALHHLADKGIVQKSSMLDLLKPLVGRPPCLIPTPAPSDDLPLPWCCSEPRLCCLYCGCTPSAFAIVATIPTSLALALCAPRRHPHTSHPGTSTHTRSRNLLPLKVWQVLDCSTPCRCDLAMQTQIDVSAAHAATAE